MAAHVFLARLRGWLSRPAKSSQGARVSKALAHARPDVPRRARRAHCRRRAVDHQADDLFRVAGYRTNARHHARPDRRFRNATTSDVVDFTGRHDFESFKRNTDKLNELDT